MIGKVKKNFTSGLSRMKWVAGFVAERAKSETSVARLLFESNRLEMRMEELYGDIGKRVMELKERGEKDVLNDFIVLQALNDIKNMKEEVADYKDQAKKTNELPE